MSFKLKNYLLAGSFLACSMLGYSQDQSQISDTSFTKENKLEKKVENTEKQEIIWYGEENHFNQDHKKYVLDDLKKRDPSKTLYLAEIPQEYEESLKKWFSDLTYNDTIIDNLRGCLNFSFEHYKKINNLGVEIKCIDRKFGIKDILKYYSLKRKKNGKVKELHGINVRDTTIAHNINRIVKENPDKDIVIHTGAFHAVETDYIGKARNGKKITAKYYPAARILKEKYGIDAKTIVLTDRRKRKRVGSKDSMMLKPKKDKLFDEYIKSQLTLRKLKT